MSFRLKTRKTPILAIPAEVPIILPVKFSYGQIRFDRQAGKKMERNTVV